MSITHAPWYSGDPTPALSEAVSILSDGVWQAAASDFYADKVAKESLGKQAPKGVQRYLNRTIANKLETAGWENYGGRFVRDRTWVRVTFRHQMSLGSDIVDALRAVGRERMEQVAILAGSATFLSVVSPNDQHALVSYEKLKVEIDSLDGCVDIPLLLGCLDAGGELTGPVSRVLKAPRPRDTYSPAVSESVEGGIPG